MVGKTLAIIGLLVVLVMSAACGGAKSVAITGPDIVDARGGVFTATAEGATPLYGQVVFQWLVNGSEFGDFVFVTADASGSAQHTVGWKPTGRATAAIISVFAFFIEPGGGDPSQTYDEHTVVIASGR